MKKFKLFIVVLLDYLLFEDFTVQKYQIVESAINIYVQRFNIAKDFSLIQERPKIRLYRVTGLEKQIKAIGSQSGSKVPNAALREILSLRWFRFLWRPRLKISCRSDKISLQKCYVRTFKASSRSLRLFLKKLKVLKKWCS